MLDSSALKESISIYDTLSYINYIYTNQKEIDVHENIVGIRRRENVHRFFNDLTYNCHFQGHLKSFRKNIIGKKRFNENIKSAVDWDFFLNLYPSLRVFHLPKFLYYYRMNEEGISFTKREEVRDNSVKLIKKYLEEHNVCGGADVVVFKVKLKESLTYYDHLINGKSTMRTEARSALERYLLKGY